MFNLNNTHLINIAKATETIGEIYFHGDGNMYVVGDKAHEIQSKLKKEESEGMAGILGFAAYRVKLSKAPDTIEELEMLLLNQKSRDSMPKEKIEQKSYTIPVEKPKTKQIEKKL